MKLWLKIILVLAVIGIAAGVLVYFFIYNKPHTDFEKKKAEVVITAKELFDSYTANKKLADSLFTGKVLEISGELAKAEETDSIMTAVFVFSQGEFGDEGIRCVMLPNYKDKLRAIKPGTSIKIKGYCTGYDDTDVKLDNCTIEK